MSVGGNTGSAPHRKVIMDAPPEVELFSVESRTGIGKVIVAAPGAMHHGRLPREAGRGSGCLPPDIK